MHPEPARPVSAKSPALHSLLCCLCGLGFCPFLPPPFFYSLDPRVLCDDDDVAVHCPEIT